MENNWPGAQSGLTRDWRTVCDFLIRAADPDHDFSFELHWPDNNLPRQIAVRGSLSAAAPASRVSPQRPTARVLVDRLRIRLSSGPNRLQETVVYRTYHER